MDAMSHGLKMAKMFSETSYQIAGQIQPYWLQAMQTPQTHELSMMVALSPDTWSHLVKIAEYWDGPISATLRASSQEEIDQIREIYYQSNFSRRTDIHLIQSSRWQESNLISHNAQRNIARLYARTEFVCDVPSDIVVPTNLKLTFEKNKETYLGLLRQGDVLVIPTFGLLQDLAIPTSKAQLLQQITAHHLTTVDSDRDWDIGPNTYNLWTNATTLYPVENYDIYYKPIVIESKFVQPWCPERFLENRAACSLVRYLAGSTFHILPKDFAVQLENKQSVTNEVDVRLNSF
ncbi:hypothetical protein DFQ28_008299 [Apophysomyces sp. BC1034]|nr:hypothetical protein DFQ29_006573 [Apophysomyces sp. BC1021]KAG0192676.1 hypothetical protein DFQ28_008299 [Apophysomyces sp. BC1034]